jgi:hypothetical protein
MASNSIVYSGTAINALLAPVVSGYTRTAAATNITQGGVDINTLYAGWDNRAGNQPTATGAVKTVGTDIATLFNKVSPAIGVVGSFGLPTIFISYRFYSGRLLSYSVSGTGPIKIDYSDKETVSGLPVFSGTFTNPFSSSFNNYAYQSGISYTWTITAGGGTGGYVTATGSFTPSP